MINKTDQEVIEDLRNFSGYSTKVLTEVFLFFHAYASMSYANNEPIPIPYCGNIFLKYEGENITLEGKEAIVTGFFSVHDDLKKLIGEIEDAKKSNNQESYVEISALKYIMKKIEDIMRKEIE